MTNKRRIPIMKKTYEKPTVETVKFQYRDQVVVASGGHTCIINWTDAKDSGNCYPDVVQNSAGAD